jgi:hypothetical protein
VNNGSVWLIQNYLISEVLLSIPVSSMIILAIAAHNISVGSVEFAL